ncbi:hypothetical protein ACTXT7_000337 [Hymenolepis weldensis]
MANLSLLAFLISICIVLNEDGKVTTLPVTTFTESIDPENQSTTSDENSTTSSPSSEENDIYGPGENNGDHGYNDVATSLSKSEFETKAHPKSSH